MQLSGGRDSRVLAAAAAAGGVEAEMRTTGTLDAPDVQLARQVTDVLGLEHRVASPQPDDGMHTRLPEMARWLALTGGGAISLEYAAGYFSAREGPLPLWVNGQGGEIARAYYGSRDGGNRDGVLGGLVARVAGGARLLNKHARARWCRWSSAARSTRRWPLESQPRRPRRLLPSPPNGGLGGDRPRLLSRVAYVSTGVRPPSQRPEDGFASVIKRAREALAAPASAPLCELLNRGATSELLRRAPASLGIVEREWIRRLATVSLALS